MYARITTLITTLLLTGTLAQAAMTGTWHGDLMYTDSDGYTGWCTTHNSFMVENDMLTFRQMLTGDCDWDATYTMKINGSELWQGDMMIGSITDSQIAFSGYINEYGDDYSAKFTMNENGTAYFWDKTIYYGYEGYWDSLEGNMMMCMGGDEPTTPPISIKPAPARFRLTR